MRAITPLGPGDEAELERFLAAHADSSMFLRQNLGLGLVDRGEPLQGTWVAARDADGAVIAVASHNHKGNLMLQGDADAIGDVARAAVALANREVRGLFGPCAQVAAARAALGLTDRAARLDTREDLLALALDELRVPPPLADGRWSCRHPIAEDAATLARWNHEYRIEALGEPPSPPPSELPPFEPQPHQWVLVADGQLAASSLFTSQLPDAVQIGGVYTPPALRGRGHARAVVAGSLVDARARGVARAILFTANPAALAAYVAIGFRVVGDYALVVF